MSFTQTIARHVLCGRLYESLRSESESWVMRCPCGAETSVWDMGGIRWKATGEPRRMGKCSTCARVFWGTVYRTNGHNGHSGTMNQPRSKPIVLDETAAVLVWIDGVGCWIAFPGERVTIGGPVEPGSSRPAADLCVLANLRRQHGTIQRLGEAYQLQTVDGDDQRLLTDGEEISLGGQFSMQIRLPSVLSRTATLVPANLSWPRMFAGPNTPVSVDGLVLLEEVCLLGQGADAHIPCPDWEETVVLYRRNGQLWCRSQQALEVDGHEQSDGGALSNGSVVEGEGWRFRVEAVAKEGIDHE